MIEPPGGVVGVPTFPLPESLLSWLADCSNVSPLCKGALPGHFLSEKGLEYRFLCCQATGVLASFSPVRERAGALDTVLIVKG